MPAEHRRRMQATDDDHDSGFLLLVSFTLPLALFYSFRPIPKITNRKSLLSYQPTIRFDSCLRGSAAETPVSQPSNSRSDKPGASSNLGSSSRLDWREAKPTSHVVAVRTSISSSQGR